MTTKNFEDLYELSPMQQGMLFHCLHDRDNKGLYVIQMSYAIHGPIDASAFERAWQKVFSRHAVLRTFFNWKGLGKPLQVVQREVKLPLEEHDWRGLDSQEQQQRLQAYLREDHSRGFDLSKPPLFRLALIRLDEGRYRFVWTFHHILFEGWSASIILKELFSYYRAFSRGENIEPERPRPYRDYILWLQRQDIKKAEAYWRKELDGFTAPTSLPVERLHGNPWADVTGYAEEKVRLSNEISKTIDSFAKKHRLTLNTVVQGAWSLLLSRYSAEENVVFGATVSGRPPELPGSENMVGLFINTLPVRVQVSQEEKVLPWLQRLQSQSVEMRQYEYSPLMEVQGWSQIRRGLPLFESILVFENWLGDISLRGLGEGLEIGETSCTEGGTGYPLTVAVAPGPEFHLTISYSTARFDAQTIRRMQGHFQKLLEEVVADPGRRVSELAVLTESERQQVLVEWNNTAAEFPREACLHHLFEAQAERTPEAMAVVFEHQRMTYRELNTRANQLAHRLRALGVGPEVLVGICVERSLGMVVGLLGVLKAGGAYIPLDPLYPSERLAFMLKDSRASVLLTERNLLGVVGDFGGKVFCLDEDWGAGGQRNSESLARGAAAENLAYVIYTSGSTGKPKGVQIVHRAVVNFLSSMRLQPRLTDKDTVLAVTSLSFDIAGLEIFLPLVVGAQLVLVSGMGAADGRQLSEMVEGYGATAMQATPATWRLMLEAGWRGSKGLKIVCGGEALSRELAQQLLTRGDSVWNLYGPTETTIWSALYRVESGEGSVPIGRAIANTWIYVLDRYLQPVAIGVPGEVYIGGDGLARGYLNYPELTAERFMPDPWSREPGARLYRTGDVGRYLSDGNIEFLGRIDHQVKVRGFRVELGEIEAVLAQHPAVGETVVLAREEVENPKSEIQNRSTEAHDRSPKSAAKRLVTYIVPRSSAPTVSELRDFLQQKLPDYMVPSAFMFLDALPLTPNGKVDRRALPAPDQTRPELEEAFVAPRDTLELQLTKIWENLLDVKPVGAKDNFFDLGGHSLLAVRLFAQIEKTTGKNLPLAVLFQAPTVEHLAAVLRQEKWEAPWSSLVAIQPGGSKPPFFGVHAHEGNILFYRDLARRLGKDQPFYGLQAQGLDGSQPLHTRVEEMAAHYVKEICTLQPKGPYFLGGYCFGGVVAFEMAHQLHAQGEWVALVALFDAYAPGSLRLSPRSISLRDRLRYFIKRVHIHFHNLSLLGAKEKLDYIKGRIKRIAYKFSLGTGLPSPRSRREILKAMDQASINYHPQVYQAQVTLFRATTQPAMFDHDPKLGWGRLAAGDLEIHQVPGYYGTMMLEPHVRVLAEQLRACLLASHADESNKQT